MMLVGTINNCFFTASPILLGECFGHAMLTLLVFFVASITPWLHGNLALYCHLHAHPSTHCTSKTQYSGLGKDLE